MSEGSEYKPPQSGNVIQKSPHELTAQVESVYSPGYKYGLKMPESEGQALDDRYKDMKKRLEDFVSVGVSDEDLQQQLEQLYKEGAESSIYSPFQGDKAGEMESTYKNHYLNYGYTDEQVAERARSGLGDLGYVGMLRRWRQDHESDIRKDFEKYIADHPMSPEDEAATVHALLEQTYYLSSSEQRWRLMDNFPGGNYLFHGTNVEQVIGIVDSGELLNAKALWEREEKRHAAEGGDKKIIRRNSGYEGISWNYNAIGALPGDRYHLAGFLMAPDEALGDNYQLTIPSRPAPHELILLDKDVDPNKFYTLKCQEELIYSFSLGESNSVWSNIVALTMYKENLALGKQNAFMNESSLVDFVGARGQSANLTQELKGLYTVRDNGTIEFSTDLLQQIGNEIPVAAVWFQAIIDTGRIKNIPDFAEVETVQELIAKLNENNYKSLGAEFRKEKHHIEQELEIESQKVGDVVIDVSKTFLVVPEKDLKQWLRVIARSEHRPKGIVVYDSKRVRLEHFATLHKGDADKLSEDFRSTLPVSDGYIDFEDDILGKKMTSDMMVGHKRHVLAEKHIDDRKSMVRSDSGIVVI